MVASQPGRACRAGTAGLLLQWRRAVRWDVGGIDRSADLLPTLLSTLRQHEQNIE